jgi:polar amino acid transport system substrate-binding protein
MKLLLALIFLVWTGAASAAEVAYDRVIKSGTLRCGYMVYPPYSIKDLATGKMSGIYPDLFEKIVSDAGLKLEWAEEIAMDTMFAGLAAGRYDAICTPVTFTVARARQALFTEPFAYVPFYVYVRKDEPRFNGAEAYAALNAGDVTFMTLDGDLTEIFAKQKFPAAKTLSAGNLTDAARLYLNVADGKADAIIGEPVFSGIFMENNPGKLRQVAAPPVHVVAATAAVGMGEHNLLAFFNTAFTALTESGALAEVISRYVPHKGDVLMAAKPYEGR